MPDSLNDELLEEQVNRLEGIELVSFTAAPEAIGPFGASTLRWNVSGVKPGVRILLENLQVPAAGHRTVQPLSTQSYLLVAAAGTARTNLGRLVVSVDTSSCTEVEILGAFRKMHEFLYRAIDNDPSAYWVQVTDPQSSPRLMVWEDAGLINYRIVFRRHIPNTPDVIVTCSASFGLAIQDNRLVAAGVSAKGSAEFPTWFWFLSGIVGGLALALNDANQKATDVAHSLVAGLVALLNLEVLPEVGNSPRTAHVSTDSSGASSVTYVQCSDEERAMLADSLTRIRS